MIASFTGKKLGKMGKALQTQKMACKIQISRDEAPEREACSPHEEWSSSLCLFFPEK